jgi:hypothetical protein
MSVALASEAFASRWQPSSGFSLSSWLSGKAKTSATPMVGEPDMPGGPLPPKVGPYPSGGGSSCLMDWTLRVQLWIQNLLTQSPKRVP